VVWEDIPAPAVGEVKVEDWEVPARLITPPGERGTKSIRFGEPARLMMGDMEIARMESVELSNVAKPPTGGELVDWQRRAKEELAELSPPSALESDVQTDCDDDEHPPAEGESEQTDQSE
jgi:hypothetical protein